MMQSSNGLITITDKTLIVKVTTIDEAWEKGVTTALVNKRLPSQLRMYLYGEVTRLVKFIDAKKTLQTEDEIIFTVDALIQEFPVMKVEEWHHVFSAIKLGRYGKLYERLKTQEIIEVCKMYEGERAERIEAMKHQEKVQPKEWSEGLVCQLKNVYEQIKKDERTK